MDRPRRSRPPCRRDRGTGSGGRLGAALRRRLLHGAVARCGDHPQPARRCLVDGVTRGRHLAQQPRSAATRRACPVHQARPVLGHSGRGSGDEHRRHRRCLAGEPADVRFDRGRRGDGGDRAARTQRGQPDADRSSPATRPRDADVVHAVACRRRVDRSPMGTPLARTGGELRAPDALHLRLPNLAVAGAATIAFVVHHRRDRTLLIRPAVSAAVVLALCWAMPLWDQLAGSGNAGEVLGQSGGSQRSVGASRGLRILAESAFIPPFAAPGSMSDLLRDGPRPSLAAAVVALSAWTAVLVCLAIAMRRRHRGLAAMSAIGVVALAGSVLAAIKIPPTEQFGIIAQNYYWAWPIAVFIITAVVGSAMRPLFRWFRDRVSRETQRCRALGDDGDHRVGGDPAAAADEPAPRDRPRVGRQPPARQATARRTRRQPRRGRPRRPRVGRSRGCPPRALHPARRTAAKRHRLRVRRRLHRPLPIRPRSLRRRHRSAPSHAARRFRCRAAAQRRFPTGDSAGDHRGRSGAFGGPRGAIRRGPARRLGGS